MQQSALVIQSHSGAVRRLACQSLLPLLLTSVAVQAQQPAPAAANPETQTVQLTGTRLPITPSGLAQTITVVTDETIQQTNPANIEELLSRVPGVFVDRAGTGGFSSLYLARRENRAIC